MTIINPYGTSINSTTTTTTNHTKLPQLIAVYDSGIYIEKLSKSVNNISFEKNFSKCFKLKR